MKNSRLLEKRIKPRFFANFPIKLMEINQPNHKPVLIEGRTLNISESGLGLILPERLPASPNYKLSLNLEPHYTHIELKIAFRWQHHQLLEGYNECGVSIIEQSEESKGIFKELLNSMLNKKYYQKTDLTNEALEQISVKPPYFALSNLSFKGDYLHASFDREQTLINNNNFISGAEAGRHLAILGSCALALKNKNNLRHYYLATSAQFKFSPQPNRALDNESFNAKARCVYLENKLAKVDSAIYDTTNKTILNLTTLYSIMPAKIFERINARFFSTRIPSGSYKKPLLNNQFELIGKNKITCTVSGFNQSFCAGHFPNFPALPVAVIMYNFEYMANYMLMQLYNENNIVFTDAIINADNLLFAKDDKQITFEAELIAMKEGQYYIFGKVIKDNQFLISTLNLTANRVHKKEANANHGSI